MFKSILKTVSVFLLAIVLSIVLPMTYAKYEHEKNGSGLIGIAKWEFNINDKAVDDFVSIDLFETIEKDNLKHGVSVIAPGVSGSIPLNINNLSDVVAQYTITLTEENKETKIPIVYSLDEFGEYLTLDEFDSPNNVSIAARSKQKVTIYWKWPFYQEGQNDLDNELGIVGESVFKLSLNINIKQKID